MKVYIALKHIACDDRFFSPGESLNGKVKNERLEQLNKAGLVQVTEFSVDTERLQEELTLSTIQLVETDWEDAQPGEDVRKTELESNQPVNLDFKKPVKNDKVKFS